MTDAYKKLIATLEEIFQLDQADLDFGIYRIMNQKRDEINDFLKNKLLTQVNETLSKAGNNDGEALKKELENLETTLRTAGIDPETNTKVSELRVLYASAGSPEALTNEVFSHLTSFFRRYYNQGDFISQRRYKKDVYAIPYEGEEVKLHWANHDQYYVKTGENFKNYTFKAEGDKTIHFTLREASTEQNNNKSLQGKERRFKLADQDIFTENGNELTIWFTYEPTDKKEKQEDLNKAALQTITANLPEAFKTSLLQNKGTKSNPGRTLLEKHLNDYTARNTFDYFIHKDLGGFLKRELDFYIKNEILQIDDINLDDPQSFDRQLKVIKALKTVAGKIIALLAQLEDFQKRLWLKKKFVMQSDYCITLDRVPESLYPDIIANTEQIEEWKRLFAIDEIKADTVTLPYTEPLTIDFLKGNPYLVLDTVFFGREWKYKLLASIENMDEQCDGLLINSENFQALNLIKKRYNQQIKCIYIDPPYNTGGDEFLYKDNYQHSSWLSLMIDRLLLSTEFLNSEGTFAISIDLKEVDKAISLLDSILGEENRKNAITVKRGSVTGAKVINPGVVNISEYVLVYSSNFKYWNPEKAYREKAYDSRYGTIIKNHEDLYEKWQFESVLDAFSKEKMIQKTKLKKTLGEKFEAELLEFVVRNSSRIIQFATLDENSVSSEAVTLKGLSIEKPNLIVHLPRVDKNDYYLLGGKLMLFYKDRLIDIGGRLVPGEPISDIWDDVLPNDLHNEGGVSLRKGKKPERLLHRVIEMSSKKKEIILDFFAGSGTSCAVSQKSTRSWIGVEQGDYFGSITLTRLKNTLFGDKSGITNDTNWKGGGFFKYLRLESYEDTLNNLQLQRSQTQQSLLADPDFGEEYLLHYMLNVESRESLLNLGLFKRPFGYTLKVTENNALQPQEVDLVETFNYLIGLVVETTQIIKGNVVIEGRNLQGDKILVIWRDVEVTDNAALNEFFKKLNINTKDSEFKRIYVNGDNNLENLRTDGEQWKVVLIEEEFHKRMFDVKDV
jgi:adenine-specific DNA-methyltransferase